MAPKLNGIDHIHVYVRDREQAEAWYAEVLGLKRVEALMAWAVDGGPLTLEDGSGRVHVALFERENPPKSSAIAFGADGDGFLAWKDYLESKGLTLRVTDHTMAFSMYFEDLDGHLHEITTYDHEHVRGRLS